MDNEDIKKDTEKITEENAEVPEGAPDEYVLPGSSEEDDDIIESPDVSEVPAEGLPETAESVDAAPEVLSTEAEPSPGPVKEKKSKKGLILALVALLLLIGAGCAWFFLLGPGAKHYTVTFDTDGGDPVSQVTVLSGKEVSLPSLTRDGYSLKGWTLNGIEVKEPFIPKADVTLKAVWEGDLHSILFECIGAVPDKIEAQFRTGDPIILPADPVKAGYAFVRWEEASGKEYKNGEPMPAEDLVLHAVWMEKSFKVTFNTDGGSAVSPLILMEGIPFPSVKTTKENYTFDHWEDKNGKTVKAGDILPCEDITLYAKWKRNTFKVSFDSRGGSSVPSIIVNAGDELKLPADPVRSGYDFVTWEDKNGHPIYDQALLEPKDITLYAVWKEIKIDVTGLEVSPSAITMGIGKTEQLVVTVKPSNATDKTLGFSSSDTSVASVNDSGLITAKGKGECTITVSSSNGKLCHIPVTVKNLVTSIDLHPTSQILSPVSGDVVITCDVLPSDADIKAVQWIVKGDVDETGSRLAKKTEEGNKITFSLGTQGKNYGGSFTVQAVSRDGGAVWSQEITITVEPELSLSVSCTDGGLKSSSDEGGMLKLFSYDNKGITTVKSNCKVKWSYSTSNGVLSDVTEDQTSISFVVHNVGTGSYYQGSQIKVKSNGGQEYVIVINPVAP